MTEQARKNCEAIYQKAAQFLYGDFKAGKINELETLAALNRLRRTWELGVLDKLDAEAIKN